MKIENSNLAFPGTIQDRLRLALRFLRMQLALRRACGALLTATLASLVACPVLWWLSVRGVVVISGGFLLAAASAGALSAVLLPSRKIAKVAAAVFLDRKLGLNEKLLSVLDVYARGGRHCPRVQTESCRAQEIFLPLLIRDAESAVTVLAVKEFCRISPPPTLRYCAAALIAWVALVLAGSAYVPQAGQGEKRDARRTQLEATGTIASHSGIPLRGGSAPETGSSQATPRPEPTLSPSGFASGTGVPPVAIHGQDAHATAAPQPSRPEIASKLAFSLGYKSPVVSPEDVDSCVSALAETFARASAEDRETLFQSAVEILDKSENRDETLEKLRVAATDRNVAALCDALSKLFRETQENPDMHDGGRSGTSSIGNTGTGTTLAETMQAQPGNGVSPKAAVEPSRRPFSPEAVRERTEKALREAAWPRRLDDVVRRFFTN